VATALKHFTSLPFTQLFPTLQNKKKTTTKKEKEKNRLKE